MTHNPSRRLLHRASPLMAAAAIALSMMASGCSPKEKSDKAIERENWTRSLNDSVAAYKHSLDTTQLRIEELNNQIATMLNDFQYVENPREVEGYYILKGWTSRHPENATWVYARLSKDEGLEIIASLKGGVFNSLRAESQGNSYTTGIVAHDQALNFRHNGYNVVCFYGESADSLAHFIARNELNDVTISYLNPSTSGTLKLSAEQRKMIAATWQLYNARHTEMQLEKQIPLLSKRIDACRRMMVRASDRNDSTQTSQKE